MFKALQTLLKKPPVIIGIVTALMFQIIFSVIWMTAYSGVNDRIDKMTIAIVNEDGTASQSIVDNLAGNLPFHIVTNLDHTQAMNELEHRKLQMILTIPASFSEQLRTADTTVQLQYTINEANPVMIKNMMQGISQNITTTINNHATAQGVKATLIATGTLADQATMSAEAMTSRVEGHLTSINQVDGMNNQMVPMMMVLASYVGAMIMGMNLQNGIGMLSGVHSRLSLFGARIVINIFAAIVVALIGSSLIMFLGGQFEQGFFTFWMFQALFLCTFMFFSQFFIILLGAAGNLFNIIFLSIQLVSSGAMVPRELLSGLYSGLGQYLPATYAVQGILSVQLGGTGVLEASGIIAIILSVTIILSLLVTLVKKGRVSAPQSSPAQ